MQFTIKLVIPSGYKGQTREALFLLPREFVELFSGFEETPEVCGEDLHPHWGERNLFHPGYRCKKVLASSTDEAKEKFENLKQEVKSALSWLQEHELEPEHEFQFVAEFEI